MQGFFRSLTAFLLFGLTLPAFAASPSEVYHEARYIIAGLEALKAVQAPDKKVRIPGIQVGKSPLHAYTKSLELLEKIQRYNHENNLTKLTIPELPSNKVKPNNVLELLNTAKQALNKIIKHKNLTIKPIGEQLSGKTPSDVYEQVWQASFLMDTLTSPLSPADVLRNALMAEQALNSISSKTNKPLTLPALVKFTDKKPIDVNIQAFKLLYKLAKLERKVGLRPLLVASFPAGKILPEDVFDTTGNILAELTRITTKLGISAVKRISTPQGPVSPNDVYAQIFRLNNAIDQLI